MALRTIQLKHNASTMTTQQCMKPSQMKKPAALPKRQPLSSLSNRQITNGQKSKPQRALKQLQPSKLLTARHAPKNKSKETTRKMAGKIHLHQTVTAPRREPPKLKMEAVQIDKEDFEEPMEEELEGCVVQRQLFAVDDVDKGDKGNPLFCTEYVNDIFQYLHALELCHQPDPHYMDRQEHINHKMRCILVDWLVLVQMKFNLLQETLLLTVSIIDRFLEVFPAQKHQLQLIGVTAMLLASKYEEIYHPMIGDFAFITDNTYTAQDICQMERIMLRTVGYNLASPTAIHFLRRFSKIAQVSAVCHTTAKFLIELSLTDYSTLQFLPSQVAAAALYIAMKLNDKDLSWTPTLQYYSGYSEGKLELCANKLAQLVERMPLAKHQAVREKYSNSKFMSVAKDPALHGSAMKQLAMKDGCSNQHKFMSVAKDPALHGSAMKQLAMKDGCSNQQ